MENKREMRALKSKWVEQSSEVSMSKGNTILLRLPKSQPMVFVFLLSCREHILSVSHSGMGRKLIKWTVLKETIFNDNLDKRMWIVINKISYSKQS